MLLCEETCDIAHNTKLSVFLDSCIFSVSCIFLRSYYVYWNQDRLGETIDYEDAYWFAFISTTTVGLGDFYLEHAVLVGYDLIIWPLLFLFGFVLLSTFLTKVAEFIHSFSPKNRMSFDERLAKVNAPLCPWFKRLHRKKNHSNINDVEEEIDNAVVPSHEENRPNLKVEAAQDKPDSVVE